MSHDPSPEAKLILVLGGASSGKSAYAESRLLAMAGPDIRPLYLATATAQDREMERRIDRHRERRGGLWETQECSGDLARALRKAGGRAALVDCLTLWLNGLFAQEAPPEDDLHAIDALESVIADYAGPLVIVSNEIGWGVVPVYRSARRFRERHGLLNQRIARVVDEVVLVTAGLPLVLKSNG